MTDTESKIAEIEARRAGRRDATAKARTEQYAKDVEQIEKLETEHGEDRIKILEMASFMPGLPTVVVVRTPSEDEAKRFRQMIRRSGGKASEQIGAAQDLLAATCIAFPDADTYARMKAAWPAVQDDAGLAAIHLMQSKGKD
jgi:hypothetical protein